MSTKDIKARIKRLADASEKFAVGSLLVGAYQGSITAIIAGMIFLAACFYMTE